MTDKQISEFSISEIINDFKAILNCLKICVDNKVEAPIFEDFIPYLCTFVYSGYEYLEKQNIILDIDDKGFKRKIGKSRSKFLKQYATFNQKTYDSLNGFNKEEYIKFFNKKYPTEHLFFTTEIKNYYIASLNNKPIDNYHLSSGVLGCEIGSYIDDITPPIQSFVYHMASSIAQILVAAHIEIEQSAKAISFNKIQYADINIGGNYKNFGIQNNPPILMAFMDILCTVNSYNDVFTEINTDERFDLKVKYLIFFESIQGIKRIIEFCQTSQIDLTIDKAFTGFIDKMDKTCCKNQLRRYCAHYGYKETNWRSDPIIEVFEKHFEKPFAVISKDISAYLLKLSIYLNAFVIKMPFINLD